MILSHPKVNRRLFVLVTVLVMAGCQEDLVKPPFSGLGDLVPLENYPRIVTEGGLQGSLVFSPSIVQASTDSRPMSVAVPIRSIWDKNALNVQYRFEFYDLNGILLEPESGWRFVNLAPRVQVQISGNALHTKATDWRLVVRSAR